jgi:hypothetical protein
MRERISKIKEIKEEGKGSVDHHGRKTLSSLARPRENALSRLTKRTIGAKM